MPGSLKSYSALLFRFVFIFSVGLFGSICILQSGCGGASGDFPVAPVSGVVTMDGSPLADATVTFVPSVGAANSEAGPFSRAKTDKDGKFSLETRDGLRGAVVGSHQVEISRESGQVEQEVQRELERLRRKAITANKDLSQKEEMDLVLRLTKKYQDLPNKFDGLQFSVQAEGTSEANFDLTGS